LAYQSGAMSLAVYAEKLAIFVGHDGVPASVGQFLEANRIERRLNFESIESQRRRSFEKLAARLSERETQTLIADTLAYRERTLPCGTYYRALERLCAHKNVDLTQTPMFNLYIR